MSSVSAYDGVTIRMLKSMGSDFTDHLLSLLNMSIRSAHIPPLWKLAKIILGLKNSRLVYEIDNIRPIALTSNFVELVENVLHDRLMAFITANTILSPCQIALLPGCFICFAHVDFESRIRLARKIGMISALVTMDVTKVSDSVDFESSLIG